MMRIGALITASLLGVLPSGLIKQKLSQVQLLGSQPGTVELQNSIAASFQLSECVDFPM